MAQKEFVVTPWEVSGKVDYDKLIERFGTERVDEPLLKRMSKYGELHLGLSAALGPICLSIFWGGLSASRLLAGFLSQRVPDMSLLTASILLTLAGQLFSFLIRNPAASLIGLGVTGIGMGAIWPTLVAMAGARHRQSSGKAIGIMVASGGLGVAFVQIYVGFFSQPHLLGLRFALLSLAAFTAAQYLIVRWGFSRASAFRRA